MKDYREEVNDTLEDLFYERLEDYKQMYGLKGAVNEFKRLLDVDFGGDLFSLFNCGDLEYFILPLYIAWLSGLEMAENITALQFNKK